MTHRPNYKAANLTEFTSGILADYADKKAFSSPQATLSFSDVDQKASALAHWLQTTAGLEVGDRIAIQLPNILDYPVAAYAAFRAGLVIVNNNPLYTAKELTHQFNDSGAKALIVFGPLSPMVAAMIDNTQIKSVVVCGADADKAHFVTMSHVATMQEIVSQSAPDNFVPHQAALDDLCVIQYTGGTTGVSKGACLSHGNLLSNCRQVCEILIDHYHNEDEVFVCPLPLYHIYAFTLNLLVMPCMGHHSVLIPNPRDLDAFVAQIKPHRITGLSGLNTLFIGLCHHPEFKALDFSGFKLTVSGGTALTSSVASLWQSVTGCEICEGYGLSETAPVLCLNKPGDVVVGTVGAPAVDTLIELRDQGGNPAQVGEIVAKGPQVMSGYWQRQDETDKVFTDDGFFKTGDIGEFENGRLKIVDRLKDLIIVSGFNVYPNEVEDVLTQHPKIMEAAVIGKPSDKTGEQVCAFITTSETLSDEEVITHCQQSLTAYKVPKQITIVSELPKSAVGKILRRELR